MESNFHEAIEIYSSCINRSKGRDSFDPKLLSNRASAYLRLKQYNNALNDAEEYITYSPECWRDYARRALALHEMNEKGAAQCSAALAFYHNHDIFENLSH
jgi:tetratricopeptide (TPR) repeat protein